LTEYEILVQIWYSLQLLFEQYVEIEVAIQYVYIGDWGYVCDLQGLAIDIQTATTTITIEEVITIVGGTCPLFDAINECGQNATSSEQAAIQVLIQELTVIINGGYSFAEILVQISIKIEAFFVQYPDLEILFYSGEIEGFGILQSFINICKVYWRIEYFSIAVSGTDHTDCALLESLYIYYTNVSNPNITARNEAKELYDKLVVSFPLHTFITIDPLITNAIIIVALLVD
jgi:hypothetical protein